MLLLLLAPFALACSSGDDEVVPTPTPGTQEPPGDAQAIRAVDLNQNAEVQRALAQAGSGRVEPSTIVYGDVTGDLREEALVPISSGGTLGNVAYLVFTSGAASPSLVLTRTPERGSAGGLKMVIEDGVLVETAVEYGPSDALCCPSITKRTSFRWDGSKLQVLREDRVQATPGPKQ
jgi:hypothetical protein